MNKFFRITDIKDIINCFRQQPEHKYHYLGYPYNFFEPKTIPYLLVYSFIKEVDRYAKPKWCPRWFLNLLHFYGNDNSIVRVRFLTLAKLHSKLTKGYAIHDIKEKWGELRIYGSFNDILDAKLDAICKLIDNKFLKPY